KRKDPAETKDENSGGTYGFDNTGSFIRRRLAVVNEYEVTSDGPNSGSLQVKYTKQYHNPNATPTKTDASGGQPPVQPHSDSTTASTFLGDNIADLQRATTRDRVRAPVPVRSISLLKHGSIAYAPSPADAIQHELSLASGSAANRSMSAVELGMPPVPKSTDSLMLACRDLSTLSLLSHHHTNNNGGGGFGSNCVPNMLGLVGTSMQTCSQTNPIDFNAEVSGSFSSSKSSILAKAEVNGGDGGEVTEPSAKRPKSQSFAYPDRESALASGVFAAGLAYSANIPPRRPVDPFLAESAAAENVDISQSLVESFLANPGVSELLQSTWQNGPIVSSHPAFLLQSMNPSMGSANFNVAAQGVGAIEVENRHHHASSSDVYTEDYESDHDYDDDHNSDDDDDVDDDEIDDDDDDDDEEDSEARDIRKKRGGHVDSAGDKLANARKIGSSKYAQSSDSIESIATKVHPSSRSSEHGGEYYAHQNQPIDAQKMAHTLQSLDMATGHQVAFGPQASSTTVLGGNVAN
ncbi:hypothetical protein GGF44_003681, partial [Coemansia sp. RSA 1694]